MTQAQLGPDGIEEQLNRLMVLTRENIKDWNGSQIATYVYVGESELATDALAHEYLARNISIPYEARKIFVALAHEMHMLDDPEWDGIRKIIESE